jgi:hypothetical protein
MRKFVPIVLSVAFVAVAAPAGASSTWVVPQPAPDTPPALIQTVNQTRILEPTPPFWAPRGKLIADSGFRPERDGLGMLNWANTTEGPQSLPIAINHYYLGYPLRAPVNLTPQDTRRILGKDEACVRGRPGCTLTLSARLWQDGVNAGMAGGHCFGIAATVSQIFNGLIPKSAIGATSTPYKAPWSPTLMRQVARAFSTQDVIDLDRYTYTPRQVIKKLKESLRPGSAPFVAAIRSTSGEGHGVTPIALYKRGKGLYDVAIYDNNYPGRTRAFHIDTNKNTFTYLMFTVPGGSPLVAEGDMQLVPVEDLLPKNLPCLFCPGAGEATVSIDPIKTTARVNVRVTAPDGSPIKGLKVIAPTNPSSLHGYQSFPKYVVPAQTRFRVSMSSPGAPAPLEASVTVKTGAAVFQPGVQIRPSGTASLTYSPDKTRLTLTGTTGSAGPWIVSEVLGSTEWMFVAFPMRVRPHERVSVSVDAKSSDITLSRTGAQQGPITLEGIAIGAAGATGAQATMDGWSSGGSVKFSYGKWTGPTLKGFNARFIARDGTRTPLKFELADQ